MLDKLVPLMLSVILVAGCGCVSSNEQPSNRKAQPSTLLTHKVKDNSAVVRVEFIISRVDVEAYPEGLEAFIAAAQEWVKVAPVEIGLLIPRPDSDETVASLMAKRPTAIILDLTEDIQAPEDKNYLGTFSWRARRLNLDMADFYKEEFLFEKAKSTAMHELGHLFGLRHVYNSGDIEAPAGSLIVQSGAESMLMAPSLPKGLEHHDMEISPTELEYAIKYIQAVLPTKLDNF